jgi:tyrosyl-tRNA synthetase
LALEITQRYHSEEAATACREEFERVFRDRELPQEMPTVSMSWKEGEVWIVNALTESNLVKSSSEGRRMIQQGAVQINGTKITDLDYKLPVPDGEHILKVGKKRFVRLVAV